MRKWKLQTLATLILSHSLPLVLLAILITRAGELPPWFIVGAIILLAAIFGYGWYRQFVQPLNHLDQEVYDISEGIFSDSNLDKHDWGAFGSIAASLKAITNKLEEFSTRTQAETEVIAAEANRLRMILNSINDGVLALDKDKHIILFNRAASKITGFKIADVAGKHINEVMPLMQHKKMIVSQWFDEAAGLDMTEESWEAATLEKENGETLNLDVDALYVGTDPNGVRALLTFHNRSEEQEIEDMKVDFVALAAHELRTPVAIIRGYLEILSDELGPQVSDEHKEFIRKLDISASQLSGSINNILHVSHIEHGELNLQKELVDWREVVNSVCNELETKAKEQDKHIDVKFETETPSVSVDKVSISEVISNLIDNAIKYSPSGATINVRVRSSQGSIVTEIIDHGVGIPSNAMDKLFTKFYRSHRTRSSHRGTGLGLYMSKAIVEAHNGRIWVESKEGEGSLFGFELPEVANDGDSDDNSGITRGVHGWIKNHSLYRG